MKNWFNNLKDKYKLLLVIGLYVGSVLFVSVELLCVVFLFFAILFTVFYVQYKKGIKQDKTSKTEKQNAPAVFNEFADNVNNSINQIEQPVKKIGTDHNFSKIDDGYLLRWQYRENICLVQNLDKVKLNDCDIQLVPEPDNQYDKNAVALYKNEYKLGYFYKGQTQEMILSYINRKDYLIKTIVCLLDDENNKLAVGIAFYQKLDALQLESLTVPLTKITKKVGDLGRSRYENFDFKEVGDIVEITDNYDGSYTVCDDCGYDLGELNAETAEKIEDFFDDIVYAKIAELEETENGGLKVKISIFYR